MWLSATLHILVYVYESEPCDPHNEYIYLILINMTSIDLEENASRRII